MDAVRRRRWPRRLALGAGALALAVVAAWAFLWRPVAPAAALLARLAGPLPTPADLTAAGATRWVGGASLPPVVPTLDVPGPTADAPLVLLVAGVTPEGIADARVGRLALALRAAGCAVVAPEVRGLTRPGDDSDLVGEVVGAWSAALRGDPPRRRVAMLGVSLGAGLVVRAIARGAPGDPPADSVSAVLLVGPPDDVVALAPRWFREPVAPASATGAADARSDAGCFARHRILRAATATLVPQPDRAAVHRWLDEVGERPAGAIDGPPGLASEPAARLVRVTRAEADLSAADLAWVLGAARPFLEATSPAAAPVGALDRLRMPVFVLHGLADPLVPAEESDRLRDRLRAARTDVLKSTLLSHVDVGSPGLLDTWHHLRFVQGFLDEAEARR